MHREEIDTFLQVTQADKIKFHALSYQELISTLNRRYRPEHEEYISYITERYLGECWKGRSEVTRGDLGDEGLEGSFICLQ